VPPYASGQRPAQTDPLLADELPLPDEAGDEAPEPWVPAENDELIEPELFTEPPDDALMLDAFKPDVPPS
jgi:hypothetical protein